MFCPTPIALLLLLHITLLSSVHAVQLRPTFDAHQARSDFVAVLDARSRDAKFSPVVPPTITPSTSQSEASSSSASHSQLALSRAVGTAQNYLTFLHLSTVTSEAAATDTFEPHSPTHLPDELSAGILRECLNFGNAATIPSTAENRPPSPRPPRRQSADGRWSPAQEVADERIHLEVRAFRTVEDGRAIGEGGVMTFQPRQKYREPERRDYDATAVRTRVAKELGIPERLVTTAADKTRQNGQTIEHWRVMKIRHQVKTGAINAVTGVAETRTIRTRRYYKGVDVSIPKQALANWLVKQRKAGHRHYLDSYFGDWYVVFRRDQSDYKRVKAYTATPDLRVFYKGMSATPGQMLSAVPQVQVGVENEGQESTRRQSWGREQLLALDPDLACKDYQRVCKDFQRVCHDHLLAPASPSSRRDSPRLSAPPTDMSGL